MGAADRASASRDSVLDPSPWRWVSSSRPRYSATMAKATSRTGMKAASGEPFRTLPIASSVNATHGSIRSTIRGPRSG
jgi:hypothetical protein